MNFYHHFLTGFYILLQLSSTQEYIVNQQNSIINDCLRLIKNILHVPNDQYQDQILRMLFSEQFDEVGN